MMPLGPTPEAPTRSPFHTRRPGTSRLSHFSCVPSSWVLVSTVRVYQYVPAGVGAGVGDGDPDDAVDSSPVGSIAGMNSAGLVNGLAPATQVVATSAAATAKVPVDRAGRDAEIVGDLLLTQAFEVAQDDDPALGGAEGREGLRELVARRVPVVRTVGGVFGHGCRVDEHLSAPATPGVDPLVGQCPSRVGQRVALTCPGPYKVGAHERLLHQLLGLVDVTAQEPRRARQRRRRASSEADELGFEAGPARRTPVRVHEEDLHRVAPLR